MIDSLSLFSVDIHKITLSDWSVVKDNILSLVPFDDKEYSEDTIEYTDYSRKDMELPYIPPLIQFFTPHIQQFAKVSQYKFSKIDWIWCQKYLNSDHHMPHNHGSIGYSCVFYANLTEEQESTVFVSPFINVNGNYDSGSVPVSEGDLIFFPSNLLHFASPNKTNEERIIFSFNLK